MTRHGARAEMPVSRERTRLGSLAQFPMAQFNPDPDGGLRRPSEFHAFQTGEGELKILYELPFNMD